MPRITLDVLRPSGAILDASMRPGRNAPDNDDEADQQPLAVDPLQ